MVLTDSDGTNRNNLSRIDTSFIVNVYDDTSDNPSTPSRVVYGQSPSASPSASPSRTKIPTNVVPLKSTNIRARNESRKLLSHVLIQLANRHKPNPVVDALTNTTHESPERGFGAFAESFKEAVKHGIKPEKISRGRSGSQLQLDDSDEEQENTFSTDDTIELMIQLKDVLTMSIAQGWKIFDDSPLWQDSLGDETSKMSSTFRRSRRSSRSAGKRSRSSSPTKGQIHVPELLSLCISILGSVVSEDCRYRVVSPRPSRPPNALQILTLNIAQFLIHTHHHDPQVISQIAFALIPAFSTFDPLMHPRLLAFFESSIIRIALLSLTQQQGQGALTSTMPIIDDPIEAKNPPIISIQIEEAPSESHPTQRSLITGPISRIQSTNNPGQRTQIYFLAFIIPPLLSAIFDSMDTPVNSEVNIPSNVSGLLRLISESKLDSYNDLLEIIAFRGTRSRRLAIAALAKLWPRAVGHSTISSPFYGVDVSDARLPRLIDAHKHQFTPWNFEADQNRVHTNVILHNDCRSCLKRIHGFSLLCFLCMTAVHSDCYDYSEGNSQVQYSMLDDSRVQRIAMCRFSDVQPNGDLSRGIVTLRGHCLRPTNWFTLCLCFVCQKPLWGCYMQGLRCGQCSIAVHFGCLPSLQSSYCNSVIITSKEMVINWDDVRKTCIEHFPVLRYTREQLGGCSHEEISLYRDVLRTQLHILSSGVLMGSVVVLPKVNILKMDEDATDKFELHHVIQDCDELITSGHLPCSTSTRLYMEDTGNVKSKPTVMFNRSYLDYITATIKTSSHQNIPRMTSAYLNVEQPEMDEETTGTFLYECVPLSHIRNILSVDFSLKSDDAACLLVNHLHQLSFFDRRNLSLQPFLDIEREKDTECVFPLPLGLDLSLNVETLVSSIEGCLADLDVSSNEFGFLLLTKRFWPNGLASEYGLKRLAGRVLSWILDEDDNLAIILREFVAKQRKLPGVRTDRNVQPWPSQSDLRPGPSSLASNGGDYVAARRSLLSRFALPWLLELHDLDPELYSLIAFDTCLQVADDKDTEVDIGAESAIAQSGKREQASRRCDSVLRMIIKLCQSSVAFTVFDAILLRWIELTICTNIDEKPCPSVYRLFSSESESTSRGSAVMDLASAQSDRTTLIFGDPIRLVLNLAQQSESGLSQTLAILPIIIKSGVTISSAFFKELLCLISPSNPRFLEHTTAYIRAIMLSLWLRSLGRQDLQAIVASLHATLSTRIVECLITGRDASMAIKVIRYSLASCLRIYGCERSNILASDFISHSEIDLLPSRRKLTVRGSGVVDPVYIDQAILSALQLYIQSNVEEIACLAVKFLDLFLKDTPFLEGFEIDNFVLRNGKLIALCVWAAYNIQREDIAAARTHLLVRTALVDSEPFHNILQASMDTISSPIEQSPRLSVIIRLFRIISDVTSPAFGVEGRQWRSSVIEIFNCYFAAIWMDPAEEVRLAVRVSAAALLPAHFEIITQCWDECLSKSPIADRVKLLGFLIQLRPHFISWKVLSWENMIDTLLEYDYDPKKTSIGFNINETEKFDHSPAIDPDMAQLRVSILLLSLQMVADGIEIDSFSLMKIKVQLVQVAGFNKISVIPTHSRQTFRLQFSDIPDISELSIPCIEELVHVLDAPHYMKLPYSALGIVDENEEKTTNVLVGSIFLDVSVCILSTLRDLSSLPVLTLKTLLESLHIMIHKYDFEDWLFQHMQPHLRRAVLRAMELLSKDISYELRQLSLSIAQATIKKWHMFFGATISTILELVAAEVTAQPQNSQDALVVQGKLLIGTTLHTFCQNGLLLSLMKRPLQLSFFNVLKQVFIAPTKDAYSSPNLICDPLLRDTLARAVDCDPGSFMTVLQNIYSFIKIVHFQGYSSEMIIFTGQHLTHIARRMSDGTIEGANPSPLILISATLMQHNRKNFKEFLPYVDTVLRISLNRLQVDAPSLTQLIKTIPSKPQDSVPGSIDIINVLFEILLDGLRMKTKMLPITIKSLVESLLLTELDPSLPNTGTREKLFRDAVDDAYMFLQNQAWHDDSIDNNFKAATAVSTLFLNTVNKDPAAFRRLLEPAIEKSLKQPLTVRSWNILLLVTLQEEKEDWRAILYTHFSAFTNIYNTMMRSYVHSGITSLATATTDVNQAHISIKLWLMLTKTMSTILPEGESLVSGVWNELWSSYEGFLDVLETEAQVGLYPALISLTATSIADLLLYMRSLKISLALNTSAQIIILNRLKMLNRADSSSNKIVRAIRSLSEPPPNVTSNVLLDQIAKELVAAERLRIVESKRIGENTKIASERSRKDARLMAG